MVNRGVTMAASSHHSLTGRAGAGVPVQDWETPGASLLPEVSWLLGAVTKSLFTDIFTTTQ